MQIRHRLILQFIGLVTFVILICFSLVYYLSAKYRKDEFYTRLEQKAISSARLFISVNQIDSAMLRLFDRTQLDHLIAENITIYTPQGKEIYTNNDTIFYKVSDQFISKIKENNYYKFQEGNHEILGITYFSNQQKFIVIAGGIDRFGKSKLNYLKRTLILMFVISLIIVSLLAWFFAYSAIRPFNLLVKEIERISVSTLSERVTETDSRDEPGRLTLAFNHLLDRLQKTFELQRLFISGASHELKNPLSSITSQLQVQLVKDRTQEEYKAILKSVLEDIQDLNKTTLDLIEYAKLNYEGEGKVQSQAFRIDELLLDCISFLNRTKPNYSIQFSLDNIPENEDEFVFVASEALMRIAILNLLDNACKFSPDSSCELKLSCENLKAKISVIDKGPGMNKDQQQFIFEPFYRINQSSESKGHGIGLALVRKILDLNQAHLELISAPGQGTEFCISLFRSTNQS